MKTVLVFLFPILEFYLLVRVGTEVGALSVILWCIAAAFLGAWVLKDHGLGVLQRMQAQLVQGVRPHDSMLSAVLVFFAGILLILPGFLSDAVGLALLIPPVRQAVAAWFAGRAATGQSGSSQMFFFRSFGPGSSQGNGGYGQGQYDAHAFQDSQDPRQVTIIDCTAEEAKEDAPGSQPSPNHVEGDGGDNGPENR